MRKKRNDLEEQDHKAFIAWLAFKYPELSKVTHHSPNGGKRGPAVGAKLKAMGTRKGFPDLVFYWPWNRYQGLVIEMKKPTLPGERKGVVSKDQKEWLDHFEKIGYLSITCNGQDEAREITDYYMGLPEDKL